jgi:lipopolysaccharide/colanic/teichoic acid biosynthesis glycosyltransferase
MVVKQWNKLPTSMKIDEIKPYYNKLRKKIIYLVFKRLFDIIMSLVLLIILSPLFLIVSILIKVDSKGPILYKQKRVTQYNRIFKIWKFRTMVVGADKKGTLVTINNDNRITKIGVFLRKTRLDEIPQLVNILKGDMSFVGTRPEVEKYVNSYSSEMLATLLLPAGVTSIASINYKDEQALLDNCSDIDTMYVNTILPEKMKYNLQYLSDASVLNDIATLIRTVVAVL